jgi:hypothetical protein
MGPRFCRWTSWTPKGCNPVSPGERRERSAVDGAVRKRVRSRKSSRCRRAVRKANQRGCSLAWFIPTRLLHLDRLTSARWLLTSLWSGSALWFPWASLKMFARAGSATIFWDLIVPRNSNSLRDYVRLSCRLPYNPVIENEIVRDRPRCRLQSVVRYTVYYRHDYRVYSLEPPTPYISMRWYRISGISICNFKFDF